MTAETEFSSWIGRGEEAPAETIGTGLLDRFRATLAPHLGETGGVPAGLHWCLSPPAVPALGLGPDGHPAKGGFLPPIPLPRRMWAGGEVEFVAPLHQGDRVTRRSRIGDVRLKTGRSGALWFVTLHHELITDRGTALRERQDIVYRAAATAQAPAAPPDAAPDARDGAEAEWRVNVDPVLLFRYSALTFNGHRIHYDEPYARGTEFYPGLVIHGPLQATLLLNLAASVGGGLPRRFAFRGLSPACGSQTLRIRAWRTATGHELAVVSENEVTTMKAEATW
ncbi:MAG: MaoC family dehydratase N-terminal domain-containing protein [Paracoccus sp. (in: a-proteobacteria)]|uniref:FAS1-like dehydratase domain-containing protein n=1 Tax=Paracoccus sp. TaxID=267 RepID=UPI0039E4D81B